MSSEQVENHRRFLTGKIGAAAAALSDRQIQEERDAMQRQIDLTCGTGPAERDHRSEVERSRPMKIRRSRPRKRDDPR